MSNTEFAEEQKAQAEAKQEQKPQPAADAEGSVPLETREPTFDSLAMAAPAQPEADARAGCAFIFS